jgi:ATP-binding cassette subfamily C protein CydC
MLALEHAPELRVSSRLDAVIAESELRHRNWGRATDRAAAPAAVAAAAPTAAVGISVLGAVVAAIGIANSVAPMTAAILMLLPLSAFEATSALPAAAVLLTRSRIAARRLRDLTEPDNDMRMQPPMAQVTLENGARLAVTGPSGAGKTTLLMTMAENPSKAAFFAEDAYLFATTVRDNLLVARGDAADEELRNVLRRVGLGSWLDTLPDGLSTILVGGAAAVSAGQRRRLLLTELLTPGALFPADRTVVATHHLPDELACPVLNLSVSE